MSFRDPVREPEARQNLVRTLLGRLHISEPVEFIRLRSAPSPWDEKIRLRKSKRGGGLDLTLWNGEEFLYGRIYRLLLYVSDALDPRFRFRADDNPHGSREPKTREIYHHLWSISVDSRIERLGIDAFFDRRLRKNLFIDVLRNLPWEASGAIFDELWKAPETTHPEMISRARVLLDLAERNEDRDAFETEISRSAGLSPRDHVDQIHSSPLRRTAEALLDFAKFHCKGTLIESSYYGIYFMRHREIFAEMVTTKRDLLLVTLFDFETKLQNTYEISEALSDLNPIQEKMQEIYDKINSHAILRTIRNPYTDPL